MLADPREAVSRQPVRRCVASTAWGGRILAGSGFSNVSRTAWSSGPGETSALAWLSRSCSVIASGSVRI